ncbi:MAG: hypothetical protein ACJAZX_001668 [Rickettsiales bacterium]|jgi:hypothetical protein
MKKVIEITKLIVNPENFRFDPVKNEQEAIDLMLGKKSTECLKLAQHIIDHGLDQSKDTRVIQKDKIFLVLDGNRRITTIKCLYKPSLIKNDLLRSKFENLHNLFIKNPIKNISCFTYEDEAAASIWIGLDHTGKNGGIGQDSWETESQKRFDLKYGKNKQLPISMQAIDLLKKNGITVDEKSIKLTTSDRVLSNPEIRKDYLGIDLIKGKLEFIANKDESLKRLKIFFDKIAKTKVGEVYNDDKRQEFREKLFGENKLQINPAKIPQLFDNNETTQNDKKITESSKNIYPTLRSIPPSTARSYLIPRDCVLKIGENRINNIYNELKNKLDINLVPNAVGVLFRVFLEVSLDYYAKYNGFEFAKDVTISQKISKITQEMLKREIANQSQLKNIGKVATKDNGILSIDSFHGYLHCFETHPSPDDLKIKWDSLRVFFTILWGSINSNTKK